MPTWAIAAVVAGTELDLVDVARVDIEVDRDLTDSGVAQPFQ